MDGRSGEADQRGQNYAVGSYWSAVPDDEQFAQGDIIRRVAGEDGHLAEYGVIITADCDIVQKKAADRLSFIEVAPIADYLEQVWAPDQLRKHVEKQCRVAVEQIAAALRRLGSDLDLTETSLADWLRRRTPEEIGGSLGIALDAKLAKLLQGLRHALPTDDQPALTRWRTLRELIGDKPEQMRAAIGTAFGGGGFPDYFVLPELPRCLDYGHVAMLRSIRTVFASEVHVSEIEARIADRPTEYHRVGRLPDGIRFAIAQKLAFLFSRIGLPEHYETACTSAAALAAEALFEEK